MNELKIRRTEITIETHSLTIIRTRKNSSSDFCEQCQRMVTTFSIDQISAMYQMSLKNVCQKIAFGEIHLIQLKGIARVCAKSLEERPLAIEIKGDL